MPIDGGQLEHFVPTLGHQRLAVPPVRIPTAGPALLRRVLWGDIDIVIRLDGPEEVVHGERLVERADDAVEDDRRRAGAGHPERCVVDISRLVLRGLQVQEEARERAKDQPQCCSTVLP